MHLELRLVTYLWTTWMLHHLPRGQSIDGTILSLVSHSPSINHILRVAWSTLTLKDDIVNSVVRFCKLKISYLKEPKPRISAARPNLLGCQSFSQLQTSDQGWSDVTMVLEACLFENLPHPLLLKRQQSQQHSIHSFPFLIVIVFVSRKPQCTMKKYVWDWVLRTPANHPHPLHLFSPGMFPTTTTRSIQLDGICST